MSKFKDVYEKGKIKVKAAGERVGEFVEDHKEGFLYAGIVGAIGTYLGFCYRQNKKESEKFYSELVKRDDLDVNFTYTDKRKHGVNFLLNPDTKDKD